MKKELLIFWLIVLSKSGFSQTPYQQVRLPLDNLKGVPYENVEGSYHLGGFEVDQSGCLYFLGGSRTTLVGFRQNQLLFRKQYKEFAAGNLTINRDKIYSFDALYSFTQKKYKNNLIELNKADGNIIKIYKQISSTVDLYNFCDSALIIEKSGSSSESSQSTYIKYDLSGHLLKRADNKYDLNPIFFPRSFADRGGLVYLGIVNTYHLYLIYAGKGKIQFWNVGINGKPTLLSAFDLKMSVEYFVETPDEFAKLRYGYIYIVGYKGKNVIVTKISVNNVLPS